MSKWRMEEVAHRKRGMAATGIGNSMRLISMRRVRGKKFDARSSVAPSYSGVGGKRGGVGGIHAEEGEGGGPVLHWMAGDATEPGRGGRRVAGVRQGRERGSRVGCPCAWGLATPGRERVTVGAWATVPMAVKRVQIDSNGFKSNPFKLHSIQTGPSVVQIFLNKIWF
jgi:hypothetical protein